MTKKQPDCFALEAQEHLTSTKRELKECRCPECGNNLDSFNFLLCFACLGLEVEEFKKLAISFEYEDKQENK